MVAQLTVPLRVRSHAADCLISERPDRAGLEGLVQVFMSPRQAFLTDTIAQALRVAGQGSPVLIAQFLKGGIGQGSDHPLTLLQGLTWVRADLARREFGEAGLTDLEKAAVASLWVNVRDQVLAGEADLVVLDELGGAIALGAITLEEVLALLEQRPTFVDVILTGSHLPPAILDVADQVSEIRRDRRS